MISPVISSRMTRSPSSFRSLVGSSSHFCSLENIRSTSPKRSCTAVTRTLSAGPAASRMGRISSGNIGLVEFGVRCGSHVVAGRSCHGTELSPWKEGRVNGAFLVSFRETFETCGSWAVCGATPLARASSSLVTILELMYCCSSHNRMRSSSFFLCFGQLSKAEALAIRPGNTLSQGIANSMLPFRAMIW